MRIAIWVFLLCAAVSAAAVFMPNLEIQIGGTTIGKHMSLSLYETSMKRDEVRRFFAVYSQVHGKKKAEKLLGKLGSHLGKKVKSHVDDVKDAMETLDEVTDDDVQTVATILSITMWSFLVLSGLMIALIFIEMMRLEVRRSRIVVGLVMSAITTAAAIGIHVAYRIVIADANDELGGHPFALSIGAYILPIAAVAGLVALIVGLVKWRPGSVPPQVARPPGAAGPNAAFGR